jgi:NAD(P)-dependent dehydrogenase (short-subunit alcohol dehydrogenase family)
MTEPTRAPRFAGRRALVTGASRGIGRGFAYALAREGAEVLIHHLGDAAAATAVARELADIAGGEPARVLEADVSRDDDVRLLAAAVEAAGGVDVLVNNAGSGARAGFFDITPELWRQTVDVNLGGTFRVSQALAQGMIARGGGAIVNVSSVSALVGSADQVHYGASKAGINGLTIAMAVALGPLGVRVNAVLPAGVPTEMNRPEGVALDDWERVGERLRPGSPVDRFGRPEDVAAAVCFLASDDAGWVTGVLLPVDGGYGVMPRAVRNLRHTTEPEADEAPRTP